ncbi:MAG: hypothetical protein M3154_12210, partial [Candidatus Eremiobacteraeota bacterium]|nr:hypothetical protein [Candidatus Eremiobacteraeota bacterium]
RTRAAHRRMVQGADVLDRLHAAGLTANGRAPRPIARLTDVDGRVTATLEGALRGRWLDTALSERTLTAYVDAVTDWLIGLGYATRGPTRTDTWARTFQPVFRRFTDACVAVADPALLDGVAALLATVPPTSTVLARADFRCWIFSTATLSWASRSTGR